MLRKSELPPTFSCIVRSRWTPRSPKSVVSTRCVIVAPTCDLMSSPMIGTPASWKRRCQYASRAMKTGMQFTMAAPARRICSVYHVVGLARCLLDDLREVLADAVVRHPARDLDPGLRHVGELDRVVRVGPDRVGEVEPDLALDDVECSHELDVRDVVAAEVDVHQSGDGALRLRVLVVIDALDERVGAVADADDRDAHLAVRARATVRRAVRGSHWFLSLAVAHGWDAESVRERGEDDVVRGSVRPRGLRVDRVSQLLRDPEQEDRTRAC